MKSRKKGFHLPVGLEIGQRFLLAFDDPSLAQTRHQGRLQDVRRNYLCIDAPAELRPARGTPVTVSSLKEAAREYSFTSEIVGRVRLHGRLPVLLVKPPEHVECKKRRGAYRVSVALQAQVEWTEDEAPGESIIRPGVMTNLSGGGAQLFLRQRPSAEVLNVSVKAPDSFVEEWAKRQVSRGSSPARRPFVGRDPLTQATDKVRAGLSGIQATIVRTRVHTRDHRGPIFALSLAFLKPQESCYRLVRYLERQAAQKGVHTDEGALISAA